jgi:predicted phage-related endonuclease
MSTQINAQMVDLDPTASAFLTAFIEARAKIKEWQEKADIAQEQVKAALGDSEIGLVNGREAVRWTSVETHRIDTKRIRELLPAEMVEKLETVTISRRFTIVDEE